MDGQEETLSLGFCAVWGLQAYTWSLGICPLRMRRVSCPKVLHARKAGCVGLSYEPGHKDRGESSGLSCCVMSFADPTSFLKASYPLHLPSHCVGQSRQAGSCTIRWFSRAITAAACLPGMYLFTWCSQLRSSLSHL